MADNPTEISIDEARIRDLMLINLFVVPIVVGGGTRSLPDGVRVRLELLDERRFGSGVVHLHYRTRT